MPVSDVVLVALIGAIFGSIVSPIIIARLSRQKMRADSAASAGSATKSLAEAMKIIADEFIRRIDAKEKDLAHKDQVVDELLGQLRASDKRLAEALEDKQRSLAFQMVIEQQASALSKRVGDLEELCKTFVAENDDLKQQLVEHDRAREEMLREIAALKTIVSRHSRHIVDLQDEKEALQRELVERDRARDALHTEIDQLRKRVEELESENIELKTRLGEVENGAYPSTALEASSGG